MPEPSRAPRPSAAPWIVAGVAGVVAIGLLITFLVALLPYRRDHPAGQLDGREKAAMAAASVEAANVLTYRRAHFDSDFNRALAGSTGSFRTELQGEKTATLQAMTQGKFDLSAKVTHVALQGPAGTGKTKGYTVLVTLVGSQSTAGAVPTQPTLQVTVQPSKGKWLVSGVTSIGLDG